MTDLKENLHTDHMVLNMGPSHPATHGTVKFLLTLDGETVVNLDVEIGYLHRGFEKMCESVTYANVFPYTDRLNYCSAIMNNIGFALALVDKCSIKIAISMAWGTKYTIKISIAMARGAKCSITIAISMAWALNTMHLTRN